jgi:hypothetical protein
MINASLATARAMQRAAPNLIVGFHTTASSLSLAGSQLGTRAAMIYTIALPTTEHVGQDAGHVSSGDAAVKWMTANGDTGMVTLAHIGATVYDANYNYSLAVLFAG